MKRSIDKHQLIRWLRAIHRDLGFLVVGLSLVYAISGILLNHMDGNDPAFRTETGALTFPTGLSADQLAAEWKRQEKLPLFKRVLPVDEVHLRILCESGIGVYNSATGIVDYEKHAKRPFVYFINKLHYNQVRHWTLPADVFAGALIFLAVSGLFIVKGKKGIAGRGKWFLLLGLLIPILYLLFL